MRTLIIAIITLVLMVLNLPAAAHDAGELKVWEQEWVAQVKAKGLTPKLLDVRLDMSKRHPEHFGWPTAPPIAALPSTASRGHQGMGNNVEQWRGLVAAYFSADKVEMALCVMAGESGGNPNAKNPNSSAAGLMQFLKSTWDSMVPASVTGGSYSSGQVYNPEANVRAAAWLQSAAGWSQWNAARRC